MMYQIIIELHNIKWREKHEYIRVVAGIGDWYIVQIEGDYVRTQVLDYDQADFSRSRFLLTWSRRCNAIWRTGMFFDG